MKIKLLILALASVIALSGCSIISDVQEGVSDVMSEVSEEVSDAMDEAKSELEKAESELESEKDEMLSSAEEEGLIKENEDSMTSEESAVSEESQAEEERDPDSFFGVFTAMDMNGNMYTNEIFSQYEITAVNFWATWCPPCIDEIPHLAALYKNLPEGANIIAIGSDSLTQTDLTNQILAEYGAEYPSLIPEAGAELEQNILSRVTAFPTTVFVDSDGYIVDVIVGAPADVEGTFMSIFNAHLGA